MPNQKSVIVIGLDPSFVDFTIPVLKDSGMNAEKVMEGLNADQKELEGLGYFVQMCLTDLGETAPSVVQNYLEQRAFDCVLIAAGIRTLPDNFILFEKLINIAHRYAPQAKICFNTKPSDTAEAVARWM
jgi:hypothetical protein